MNADANLNLSGDTHLHMERNTPLQLRTTSLNADWSSSTNYTLVKNYVARETKPPSKLCYSYCVF